MSHTPAYYHNISMKLASVLEDIGLIENTVQMRRRLVLLTEKVINIYTSVSIFKSQDMRLLYMFGSQSEGTTTIGLDSDYDNLISLKEFIVLQDIRDWKLGSRNLLMFQDKYTAPGYCMLQTPDIYQLVYPDELKPTLVSKVTTRYADKIMVMNNFFKMIKLQNTVEHGPAFAELNSKTKLVSVFAFKTLPNFVSEWLEQQLLKGRITPDMKKYIECHPCYAVPVGCKGSPNEDLEWRISTSHAERCVMFNLNITQIQCYVMLKLMLQTHLKHPSEQGLSSFMCKNIVLLCTEDTDSDVWCPDNLLPLFKLYLLQLKHCVSEEYCPHFIMHENNLMAGQFKPEVKLWLLDKIHELYQDIVSHFCCLTIDDIERRLKTKLYSHIENPENVSVRIFLENLCLLAYQVHRSHMGFLQAVVSGDTSFDTIIKKINHYQEDSLEHAALLLLSPLIYSSLGSVIASGDREQGEPLSPKALVWLSMGLDSDVTSGRLKLASVYYCSGDYNKAEAILKIIENKYDIRMVQAMCTCTGGLNTDFETRLKNTYNGKDEQAIRHVFAYGVRFLQSEIHCVPKELKYEMFRSTQKDLTVRRNRQGEFFRNTNIKDVDYWMDWAVVDSLPYMYFLQYKINYHLQRRADQKQALKKIYFSISAKGKYEHLETTLNLLGQCTEQEYGPKEAFYFYSMSLRIRPRNNAASIHICRLLNSLISAK